VNLKEAELREDLIRLVNEPALSATFKKWQLQPASELISILESGAFPFPTSQIDAFHLLDCIFDFDKEELTPTLTARLWQLVQAKTFDFQYEQAVTFRLYGHQRRTSDFIEYWVKLRAESYSPPPWNLWRECITCAGNLRVLDQRIVRDLIYLVRDGRVRCEAIVALGKIGAPAGLEAVQVIDQPLGGINRQLKDRVLQRIRTTDNEWQPCDVCRDGKVLDDEPDRSFWIDCPNCFGLSWIPQTYDGFARPRWRT
jgi:hypothetical protein